MLVISRGHREWKSCVATSVVRKRPWIRWTPEPCSQWSVSMGVECRSLSPLGFIMVYISENPQCVVTLVGKWRNHGIWGYHIFRQTHLPLYGAPLYHPSPALGEAKDACHQDLFAIGGVRPTVLHLSVGIGC
jgi:hypothetical protein